jgi:hypothetical protein
MSELAILTMSEMAIIAIIVLFVGIWSATHKIVMMVDTLQELNKKLDLINKHVFDIKEIGSERHRVGSSRGRSRLTAAPRRALPQAAALPVIRLKPNRVRSSRRCWSFGRPEPSRLGEFAQFGYDLSTTSKAQATMRSFRNRPNRSCRLKQSD